MKHRTMVEIEGVNLSPRFLRIVNGKWMRECSRCKAVLPPTTLHFHLKGTAANRILDRVCKKCRTKSNNSGVDRRCSSCGKTKPATTANFMVNRGVLLAVCRKCGAARMLTSTKRWQRLNPRKAWEVKVKSNAKRRAAKKGIPYDEAAMDQVVSSYKDGSLCPCCGKPMTGSKHWASLDRFDSRMGYEKGNMAFICYRCNWVKNDGTLEEFRGIVAYLSTRLSTPH